MIQPTNAIVLDSQNMHVQQLKVETATNMYPGRLVKKGTNDDDVVVATAATDKHIGWLGYEQTTKKHRPATVSTIYLVNAKVAVLSGPGMVLVGLAELGASITKGQRLKAGAIGGLSGGTDGTDHMVAIAEETVDASSVAKAILVRSLI
jgi:hypothetical protein